MVMIIKPSLKWKIVEDWDVNDLRLSEPEEAERWIDQLLEETTPADNSSAGFALEVAIRFHREGYWFEKVSQYYPGADKKEMSHCTLYKGRVVFIGNQKECGIAMRTIMDDLDLVATVYAINYE